MTPPAPGRLSTITCCPQRSESFWATKRDAKSDVLPGEPAMRRTGRVGYSCAPAHAEHIAMQTPTMPHAFISRLLVNLRARGDQHLGEALDLGADEAVELLGRRRRGRRALRKEALLDVRKIEDAHHLLVD